ncbi:MAG: hypothetical protein IPK97_20445 [Ahniella sp.]|nr:hypothetical protein [Ahniella sp.]
MQFVYDAEDRKFARIETPWQNGAPVPANAKATVQLYDGDQLIHEAQPSTEPASNTPNAQGLKLTDTYRRSAMMDRHGVRSEVAPAVAPAIRNRRSGFTNWMRSAHRSA